MTFSCRFCHMKVFWNTEIRNPRTGKPSLCTARGDEDYNIIHVCSVQKMLNRQMYEEEEARLNFIASVRPETAQALLGAEEKEVVPNKKDAELPHMKIHVQAGTWTFSTKTAIRKQKVVKYRI